MSRISKTLVLSSDFIRATVPTISTGAWATFTAIAAHIDNDKSAPVVIAQDHLAYLIGVSIQSVYRYISELESASLIAVVKDGRRNAYKVLAQQGLEWHADE